MRSYEERAQDFFKEFYPYIKKCKGVWDYRNAVELYNHEHNRHVVFTHGQTRWCFITSDYVIKIDRKDNPGFKMFGGCHDEYVMYHYAKREGFERPFCPIHQMIYKRKTYYVMPKATRVGRTCFDDLTIEERDFLFNNVFDMHEGNIGTYQGHPVLIDYAANYE